MKRKAETLNSEDRIYEWQCLACGKWVGDEEAHPDEECLEIQRWRSDREDDRLAAATMESE